MGQSNPSSSSRAEGSSASLNSPKSGVKPAGAAQLPWNPTALTPLTWPSLSLLCPYGLIKITGPCPFPNSPWMCLQTLGVFFWSRLSTTLEFSTGIPKVDDLPGAESRAWPQQVTAAGRTQPSTQPCHSHKQLQTFLTLGGNFSFSRHTTITYLLLLCLWKLSALKRSTFDFAVIRELECASILKREKTSEKKYLLKDLKDPDLFSSSIF